MLKVVLPDGSEKFYERRVAPLDVASEIGSELANATVAAVVTTLDALDESGATAMKTISATEPLPESGVVELRLLTKKDAEALAVMRHSCAYVMARAVMRLFKGVQLAFDSTTDDGFYYDFWTAPPFTEGDFAVIEAEMAKIIQEDEPFERIEMKRADAIELLRATGQSFKVDRLETGPAGDEVVSFYRHGEFVDLCRGPHVPSPRFIGAFKIISTSSAYRKDVSKNRALRRVCGTAFFGKKELDEYLTRLDETKKRDRRV